MTLEEILAALRAILDASEGRELTDEEVDRYEELEGKLEAVRRTAEVRARQAAYETPVNPPVTFATPPPDDTEERAFDHYLRTGQVNSDLAQFRAQGVGTDSAGGFLVPPGFRQKLTERLKEFGGIAQEAETITTESGNSIEWPTVDETEEEGEIVAEGGTFASGADVTFGTETLGAFKYMAGGAGNLPIKVSVELLQDSAFNVSEFLSRALATRIGRVQATHWATGSGSGEPEGLMTGGTSGLTLASLSTVTYDELVSIVHNVDPAYRPGSKWVFNDATLEVIRKLKDANDLPLFNSSNDPALGGLGGGTMLGYPVVIDQAVASFAASAKVIAFGQIREGYVIRRVKDVTLVVLNELYAPNGQVGFMAWARADGAVQNAHAYTIATASAT